MLEPLGVFIRFHRHYRLAAHHRDTRTITDLPVNLKTFPKVEKMASPGKEVCPGVARKLTYAPY